MLAINNELIKQKLFETKQEKWIMFSLLTFGNKIFKQKIQKLQYFQENPLFVA